MKLYNTLTRKLDEIVPLNPPTITVYTCGPTVYDYAHIGHWFNYVRMDTLIRALKAAKLQPKWVMNITDVGHLVSDADDGEDKLEKGAKREGKTAWEIAKFYETDFLQGMEQLNILTPDYIVRASEHIAEQIALIKKLEEKGYTYIIDDGVYYDTAKFEGYAAFARLDLDDQQEGARVAVNPQKRNAADFALWKFSPANKQRDMEWESPWGKGFPGWHIECSAMAMKYLGESIDLHTGGIDHVPVHHTNEIAQSEAATGKRFANYWMHSNHIMIDGEKISKSLGNGVRLAQILDLGISPDSIRLHILESHYRSQSKFSMHDLRAAEQRLKGIRNDFSKGQQHGQHPPAAQISENNNFFATYKDDIDAALSNDLNTPIALAVLNEASRAVSTTQDTISKQAIDDFVQFVFERFGFSIVWNQEVDEQAQNLLRARDQARQQKNWAEADRLRDELQALGITVNDTQHGQTWHKS